MSRTLSLLLSSVVLVAQDRRHEARSFLPPGMEGGVRVDLRALRDSEVLDELSRSPLSAVLALMDSILGFGLDDLDLIQFHLLREGDQVIVFEGNERVLPPEGMDGYERTQVGSHAVLLETFTEPAAASIWYGPRPGLVVHGPRRVLEPLLLGTGAPGVPPPEQLALVAGRSVLAYFVAAVDNGGLTHVLREIVPEDAELPSHCAIRLLQRGDIEVPQFVLEGVLQWRAPGPQQAATIDRIRVRLQELERHRRLAALKRYWKGLELTTSGSEVRARLVLGGVRETGGILCVLLPFGMLTTYAIAEVVPAQQLEVIEAVEVELQVQPDPPQRGRGKDG